MSIGDVIAKRFGIPQGRRVVVNSPDFERIKNLPRRSKFRDYSSLVTEALRKPGGTLQYWPMQAIACIEAAEMGGLFAQIGVGQGKSLITLTIPELAQLERPLLIVPAHLKIKTIKIDIPFYRQHFYIRDDIQIISYSELSTVSQADVLERIMPDGIILDEAHFLANPDAGRTRRFLRYFNKYPDTKLFALSGTITKKSIRDYWHIVRIALGENTPLPIKWRELQDWADCLDPDNLAAETPRVRPGVLLQFCEVGESIAEGFRRRLVESPGVVTTEESGIENALSIRERSITVPEKLLQAFKTLRQTWERPDGEEISDALTLYKYTKELAMGFYYRWKWPNDEPDIEWLIARKAWRKFVRNTILYNHGLLCDTEKQVFQACYKGWIKSEAFEEWIKIHKRVKPKSEPVWISDYLIDAIEDWYNHEEKGIVWIEHDALGQKLKERGLRVYLAGDDDILENKDTMIASIHAHGTGKNLQNFSNNLFACAPASATVWEQALGRTHRHGQLAQEVRCEIFLHTRELWASFWQARKKAAYIESTTGQRQRLQYASLLVKSENEALDLMAHSTDPLWSAMLDANLDTIEGELKESSQEDKQPKG